MSVVYLRDDPDRAPRLTPADLIAPAGPAEGCACPDRASLGERAVWWAIVGYFAACALAVLACGIGAAVWAWTAALS